MPSTPLRLLAAAALALTVAAVPSAVANEPALPAGTVGTDPAGDWGSNAGSVPPEAGSALGQDLVSAKILPSGDGKTLNFVIGLTALPANGGIPEGTRYTWNLDVDPTPHLLDEDSGKVAAKGYDLDGKWTNFSRGACDPTAGSCPPPRNPGLQPFVLRGDCTTQSAGVTLTICAEKAKVQGLFDPAKATISVPVPVQALALPPCGVIRGATGTFGGSVSAAPSAFFTLAAMPLDTLTVDGVYRAPSADGTPCPEIPVLDEE